jgi:hypothetical protein
LFRWALELSLTTLRCRPLPHANLVAPPPPRLSVIPCRA